MKQTVRTAVYDESLQIEAYRLQGTQRPFPNHFHGYYVIGLVESGTRRLSCRQQTYLLRPGSLLLLNPGDSHACTQCGPEMLDYKACNLSPERMEILAEDILGEKSRPQIFFCCHSGRGYHQCFPSAPQNDSGADGNL